MKKVMIFLSVLIAFKAYAGDCRVVLIENFDGDEFYLGKDLITSGKTDQAGCLKLVQDSVRQKYAKIKDQYKHRAKIIAYHFYTESISAEGKITSEDLDLDMCDSWGKLFHGCILSKNPPNDPTRYYFRP